MSGDLALCCTIVSRPVRFFFFFFHNIVSLIVLAEKGSVMVSGFERGPAGEKLVCEASGKVEEGDILVAVNGSYLAGFLHAQVVGMIRNSSNPISLTFLRKGQTAFLGRFFGVPIPLEESLRLRRVNKHCAETVSALLCFTTRPNSWMKSTQTKPVPT